MLPLLLISLGLGCGGKRLPTANLKVKGITVTAELAANDKDRARGLMHRSSMGTDDGMLFIYPESKPRSFWMKDTKIPLSIAFLDPEGRIVKIAKMQPLSKATTKSVYPAKYALEMNQGWFDSHGVKKGDLVTEIPDDATLKVQ